MTDDNTPADRECIACKWSGVDDGIYCAHGCPACTCKPADDKALGVEDEAHNFASDAHNDGCSGNFYNDQKDAWLAGYAAARAEADERSSAFHQDTMRLVAEAKTHLCELKLAKAEAVIKVMEDALRAIEIKIDWNADDLDYSQFKEMEALVDGGLAKLKEYREGQK